MTQKEKVKGGAREYVLKSLQASRASVLAGSPAPEPGSYTDQILQRMDEEIQDRIRHPDPPPKD